MKMKWLLVGATLLAASLPAMAAFSDGDSSGAFRWVQNGGYVDLTALGQLRLSQVSPNGPFQVSELDYADWYAGPQYVYEGMITWCIEREEYFRPGSQYWFSIEPVAYGGGVGLAGDPIGAVTEYLYDQYLNGNPQGWSDADVRDSIWHAEDTSPDPGPGSAYDYAVTVALINPADNASYTYALNLWTINEVAQDDIFYASEHQSHIVQVPAPGALLLGSFGVGLVGWLRRRQAS